MNQTPSVMLTPAETARAFAETMMTLGFEYQFMGCGIVVSMHQIRKGETVINVVLPLLRDTAASELQEKVESIIEAFLQ